MFSAAGLENVDMDFTQPAYRNGPCKPLWELTFRNGAAGVTSSGVAMGAQLDSMFDRMAAITADATSWVAHVRCSVVTGRKSL